MSSELVGPDPYAMVLADLRAKRAQIDQTIALLEGMRSGTPMPADAEDGPLAPATGGGIDAGSFLGMSIPDAAKKALASQRKALPPHM